MCWPAAWRAATLALQLPCPASWREHFASCPIRCAVTRGFPEMELRFDRLAHTFPGRPSRRALAEVTFSVPPGQFCAILGPSGCGKSALLRLAAGLLQPTSGE